MARPTYTAIVKEIILALGGRLRNKDFLKYANENYPGEIHEGSLSDHLYAMSVNSPSRLQYPENKKARGHNERLDILYKDENERGVFELYDPAKHGKWTIMLDHNGKTVLAKDGIPISGSSESSLLKFLKYELRKNMKANYQPIVIKTLLEKGPPFTVSIKEIRKKFDELNFGRMSYTNASGRPGGNDAIRSVAVALKKFVKFPEGTSQGNAILNDEVVNSAEIPECLKICGQEIARWHIEKIIEGEFGVWRILPGSTESNYKYEKEFRESSTIGIGYSITKDLTSLSLDETKQELNRIEMERAGEEFTKKGAFTAITHKINPKDIVVLTRGEREIIDFGIVTSKCFFDDSGGDYYHRRKVVWLNRGPISKETLPRFTNSGLISGPATPAWQFGEDKKEKVIDILLGEESESRDYWLFKAGTKVTAEWDEILDANKIRYDELGIDLSKFFDENGKSKYEIPKKWKKKFSDELKDEIDKKLSIKDFPKDTQSRGTKISWVGITARNFAEIKKNDVVVVWSGHKIHGHGKVVGGYDADYSKEVEWDKTFVEIELPKWKATPENKLELRWKAGEIQPLPDEWKKRLFGTNTSRSTMSAPAAENSDLLEYQKTLEKDLNLLFYGPPGTGKTFWAEKLAELITSNQVPPETVVELKEQTWLGVAAKVLLENNGTALHYADFAKFARQIRDTTAVTPEETIARDIRHDIRDKGDDSIFTKSSEGTYGLNIPTTFVKAAEIILLAEHRPLHTDEITEIAISMKMIKQNEDAGITPTRSMNQVITQDIANNGKNSTFVQTGPGIYVLRKQIIEKVQEENYFLRMVTFHPSYSYEEFVEGIRPNLDVDQVSYTKHNGIFKEICKAAKEDPDPDNRYVLLIDEINRGNIPKIFGELITLIEDEKREESKVNLTYTKELFTVPKNLYIIGTMNTADQSISHLDTALRRRFSHIELMPDGDLIDKTIEHNGKKINLKYVLDKINTKIRNDAGRERQIGHSYFMKNDDPITEIVTLRDRFKSKIIPLIQDYFYEDMNKVHKILGDGFIDKTKEKVKKETLDDLDAFADAVNAI